MTERILLSAPDITEHERAGILRALDSGWVAPLGPEVDAFEGEVAALTGRAHAVALSSGTAALHLALLQLGAGPGTVVITSSMTFAATANAVVYTGAEPVFVDADETGNMAPGLLAEAVTRLRAERREIAAIVPVDLLGKVADYRAIQSIADEHGIPVLSDAAESLGASREGAAAGSFGVAAAISFNGNKIMTTSGGGMLLTDDAGIAARTRYLATQARQPVVHYEHVEVGYNYRLSNLLAGLGRAQLERLASMIERRRQWRRRYRSFFAGVDGVSIFGGDDGVERSSDHDNFWLTSVVVDEHVAGFSADDLRKWLDGHNIESRPLWKPMHLQPVFAIADAFVDGTSEDLFQRGLSLPSGSSLRDDQFARIEGALSAFVEARRR